MTAQLSRERLEEIAALPIKKTSWGLEHAPGAYNKVRSHEIVEMASMLLAGMDSDPVAYFYPGDETEWHGVALAEELDDEQKARCIPLYAAPPAPVVPEGWEPCSPEWIDRNGPCSCGESPRIAFGTTGTHYHPHIWHKPAPVAVPDVGEFRIFTQAGGVKVAVKDGKTKNHLFGMGWNACRAAMLKAGPVTDWIKCSERMPEEGGRYWCYVEEQNSLGKSHYQWNCSWNGNEWSDKALTGRVTHWMPLPAAPEQEV